LGVRLSLVAIALLTALAVALPGCLKGNGGLFGSGDPPGPRDYVSSKDYTKWVIEVDSIEGMAPPTAALNLLKSRLESVANKPGGIEIHNDETNLAARGSTWTLNDVQAYSHQHQDTKTGDKTVVLHLLFLDGQYQQDNVLGVTVISTRGSSVVSTGPIAIFSQSLRDSCSPLTLCTSSDPLWAPVLIHEFGHAMGLVNTGAPMKTDHEDTAHPGHSTNTNSVMYWEVETSSITSLVRGGIPDNYDSNDRGDLCGIGGKC
jgi:hypothetical protein